MGKIKKLKDVELVGGTEQSDVYPITSTKAIYDENNKRLDSIISELQKSADSSLETENKTIVGSINELKRLQDTGYLFKGVATPTTDPGTPDAKVFYIAGTGEYTNFGKDLIVNTDEIGIIRYDNSWQIDKVPIVIEGAGHFIHNPEYILAYIDTEDRFLFGIKPDGSINWTIGVPSPIVDFVKSKIIESRQFTTEQAQEILSLINSYYTIEDAEQRLELVIDNEGKIIAYRKADGEKVENVGIKTPKINVGGCESFNTIDKEDRIAAIIDKEEKIISYRKADGTLCESVGIESPSIVTKKIKAQEIEIEEQASTYDTLRKAVEEQKLGLIQVGENLIVGENKLIAPFSAKDIEKNYKNILPNPLFPYIKSTSLTRLYDDADNPNLLYVCSHSDKHIFYSICPSDPRRGSVEPGYYSHYAANYFYYALIENPTDIHKVILPEIVNGVNMVTRITYVHEMSNGDCLIEMNNGDVFDTSYHHFALWIVKGVFGSAPITENDITLSIKFKDGFVKIGSFDNICEYEAGHIIISPYAGGGRLGKLYITKNYGKTWDLIFSSVYTNTEFIKPKAEHFGDDNAIGIYPTSDLLNPEGQINWDGTLNGNVHIHGIAYDRWYNRIWIVTGDGGDGQPHNVTGIWWTDDEGYTWKRIGGTEEIGTQLIGVIPMEHCVLFPTDGTGDGFWRWSRNGANSIIKIEECFNFMGVSTTLYVAGGRTTKTKNGFYLTTFAPENDYTHHGGVVATHNGFDFQKIYVDEFSSGTFETQEIGWACDICEKDNKIVLGAYHGGIIVLTY